jgi:arylformamidase
MNGPTAAATAPRNKGPIVWLDMDQQALDDAYDQLVYAPNRDQLTKRRVINSAATRKRIGDPLRFAYGPPPVEGLDVFPAGGGAKGGGPVAIFVHGGAWRTGSASDYSFVAEPFVRAGGNFVVLDFVTVDDTAGSLFPMAEQVRRAIGWVYRNADKFGGDRDRLYLVSHSSGSHLAGCAVTHDWPKEGLPRDILKGATLSSGMYDLKPVRLSKRSKYVKFTDAMEQELSAIRHLDKLATPLNISYGTYETPEFQRQARLRRGGQSGRQAGRAFGWRSLQPFRNAGDARESLWPPRPRGTGADGVGAELSGGGSIFLPLVPAQAGT